jgi:hypothetical protein
MNSLDLVNRLNVCKCENKLTPDWFDLHQTIWCGNDGCGKVELSQLANFGESPAKFMNPRISSPTVGYSQVHSNPSDTPYQVTVSQLQWGGSNGSMNTTSYHGHRVDELIQAYMVKARLKDEAGLEYISKELLSFYELPNYKEVNVTYDRYPSPSCIFTEFRNKIEQQLLLEISNILVVPELYKILRAWNDEDTLDNTHHLLTRMNRLLCKYADYSKAAIDYDINAKEEIRLKYSIEEVNKCIKSSTVERYGEPPVGPLPNVNNARQLLDQYRTALIHKDEYTACICAAKLLELEEQNQKSDILTKFEELVKKECEYVLVYHRTSKEGLCLRRIKGKRSTKIIDKRERDAVIQQNIKIVFFDSDADEDGVKKGIYNGIREEKVPIQKIVETYSLKNGCRKDIQNGYTIRKSYFIDIHSQVYHQAWFNVLNCSRQVHYNGHLVTLTIYDLLQFPNESLNHHLSTFQSWLPIVEKMPLNIRSNSISLLHCIEKADGTRTGFKYEETSIGCQLWVYLYQIVRSLSDIAVSTRLMSFINVYFTIYVKQKFKVEKQSKATTNERYKIKASENTSHCCLLQAIIAVCKHDLYTGVLRDKLDEDEAAMKKEIEFIEVNRTYQCSTIQSQKLFPPHNLAYPIHQFNIMNDETKADIKPYEDTVYPDQHNARKVRAKYLTEHMKRKPIQYYKPVCNYCNSKLLNKQYINLYRHLVFICYACYEKRKLEEPLKLVAEETSTISMDSLRIDGESPLSYDYSQHENGEIRLTFLPDIDTSCDFSTPDLKRSRIYALSPSMINEYTTDVDHFNWPALEERLEEDLHLSL